MIIPSKYSTPYATVKETMVTVTMELGKQDILALGLAGYLVGGPSDMNSLTIKEASNIELRKLMSLEEIRDRLRGVSNALRKVTPSTFPDSMR